MKRDLDLARKILLELERARPDSEEAGARFSLEGSDSAEVNYHIELLEDAGLLKAYEWSPGSWWPERLTWAGHEFLDACRNDRRWEKAKHIVREKAGSVPFDVLLALLCDLAEDAVMGEDEDD